MLEREFIIQALWERLSNVTGVNRTARNPVNPPSEEDMPCINFFELEDPVQDKTYRGGKKYPAYKRALRVLLEPFVLGSSEPAASKELGAFVQETKKSLYAGGNTLGMKGVEMTEVGTGQVLRPPKVEKVAGIGITIEIRYVETIAKLFT